ncbi:WD repeat protein Lub1 [Coemansia thaxteri]|uniref:WD repeat protein Lub1 n=1 Tax=Coemansia thaxteri TaxID=2663907 RepID=A0A9W8BGA4_9FUNG|nr:WD repeat protein Lub1 [Coemansia thaxteri]KAJ2006627.1 WD repeat protein Lub1 [Coemansia thaxteri]KAJ2479438.1 WD repeat protein Lub1 [Coemansia sp. RSA 2320]
MFKLSAELHGHMSDVRGLIAQGDTVLVSVSRDKTGRIWKRSGPNDFVEDSVLLGHTEYVNCVTAIPSTAENPSGLIATGGTDKKICLWDPADLSQPMSRLAGHTDNVCALTVSNDGQVLVSGSWDKTAKVWVGGECKHTLAGHQHAVWCVLVMDDGSVLTGSADKAIRRWVDGKHTATFTGHTDCVRALAQLPDGTFASAANDGSVRVWSLDSGKCLAELYGHTSFVYSLSVLPDGAIVSGGEDRSVRIWRNNELAQIIFVPSTSVWAVAALSNGDVACGTSDGVVRVFSAEAARLADPDILATFEKANSSFAVSKKTMGDIDTSKLPGPERLEQPGSNDQQVIMIKNIAAVEAYQWDKGTQTWTKVGDVVDAVGQAQKQVYNGKEYDYVFDVDIQEGMPPLKLPYNAAENPYAAAQKFLELNGISLDHIDTVANFIIKNSGGAQLGETTQSGYADPFTGSNRYVPGQSSGDGSAGSADPFTGSSRYVPSATAAGAYTPPSEFVINSQGNAAAIVKKLAEFNALVADADAQSGLSDAQLLAMNDLAQAGAAGLSAVSEGTYSAILSAAMDWPVDKRFPALDLLRLTVAASPVPAVHASNNRGFVECVGDATGFFALFGAAHKAPITKADEINLMMGARSFANAFATAPGAELMWNSRKQVLHALDGSWIKATNSSLTTALSNLYLNLAVMASRKGDDDEGLNILSAASRFLSCTDNHDAQLRLVNIFGVLSAKFRLCRDSARILGDESIVILGIKGKSDAVRRAAKEVGAFLAAA